MEMFYFRLQKVETVGGGSEYLSILSTMRQKKNDWWHRATVLPLLSQQHIHTKRKTEMTSSGILLLHCTSHRGVSTLYYGAVGYCKNNGIFYALLLQHCCHNRQLFAFIKVR